MSDPEIALYVSSNEVDHGPLSLKEASKRVQSGEFKPEDLAWHLEQILETEQPFLRQLMVRHQSMQAWIE